MNGLTRSPDGRFRGEVLRNRRSTGESRWELEWVDCAAEDGSGAVYYMHVKTGETQWEQPAGFVPIVRQREDEGEQSGEHETAAPKQRYRSA